MAEEKKLFGMPAENAAMPGRGARRRAGTLSHPVPSGACKSGARRYNLGVLISRSVPLRAGDAVGSSDHWSGGRGVARSRRWPARAGAGSGVNHMAVPQEKPGSLCDGNSQRPV